MHQVENMSTKFHQHLQFYKRDRICHSGACSPANQHNLKFVYYYGLTTIRKIGIHQKLFGSDLTLAHKLLKNTIPTEDYLLLSAPPQFSDGFEKHDWMIIKDGFYEYPGIGDVPFIYIPLAPLRPTFPISPRGANFIAMGNRCP